MRFLNRLWAVSGWVVFLAIMCHIAGHFTAHYVLGRYYMPRPVVLPGGLYSDGCEIDLVTLALAKSDKHEEVILGIAILVGVLMLATVNECRKLYRVKKRLLLAGADPPSREIGTISQLPAQWSLPALPPESGGFRMLGLFAPRQQRREQREDLIARLCRESGRWMLVSREANEYRVRALHEMNAIYYIDIRYNPEWDSIVFQSWFSVRFPLDNPPSGLFGRLLIRNYVLKFAAWVVLIDSSCEASLCVSSHFPTHGINAKWFNYICNQVVNEIADFHKELRDKFNYNLGGGVSFPAGNNGYGTLGQAWPEVRLVEGSRDPSREHDGPNGRYRLPDRRGE